MSRSLGPFLAALAGAFALSACDSRDASAPSAPVAATPAAAPVELVIFEASWCRNSAATEETIAAFEARHPGRVAVTRVDVDRQKDAVDTYGVTATPTIVFQRDGRPVDRHVGAVVSVDALAALVDTAAAEQTLAAETRLQAAPPRPAG
jgi:thioredoxin-like negative regulator of GroEL